MNNIVMTIIAVGALAIFVWIFIPTASTQTKETDSSGVPFIDPDDSQQIGMLIGLTGGTIPEAAVMRYALEQFQKIHGRRATTQDIGIVLGLIQSTR